MPQLLQVIGGACLTVLIGVAVYIFGEWIKTGILEPLNEQAKLIVSIASSLTMYANVFSNPVDRNALSDEGRKYYLDISDTLRRQSADLSARNQTIPWYKVWVVLHLAPPRKNVQLAAARLIGLSNIVPPKRIEDDLLANGWRKEIEKLLGVDYTL